MSDYALLLTGGTIGSSERDGFLSADAETGGLLLKKYREKGGALDFDALRIENILSENYGEETLFRIADSVVSAAKKGYRAVVVAAGTDNLGNLAAFSAFALAGLEIPVFLISSQFPLTDRRENGSDNLKAVDAAENGVPRGVFVLNRNLDSRFVSAHAAARIFQCDAPGGDFRSAGGAVGRIADDRFERISPAFETLSASLSEESPAKKAFRSVRSLGKIFTFRVSPYAAPALPDEPFDAAFLELFHSGTAPVAGSASVLPFLDACAGRKIPVYAAPAFFGAARYETAEPLARRGVRFLENISALAAETKLRFLYGAEFPAFERENALSENVAGEYVAPGGNFFKI